MYRCKIDHLLESKDRQLFDSFEHFFFMWNFVIVFGYVSIPKEDDTYEKSQAENFRQNFSFSDENHLQVEPWFPTITLE